MAYVIKIEQKRSTVTQDSIESGMSDELLPPDAFLPLICEYFNEAQRADPEWFDLAALPEERRLEFEEKARELQTAGPMRREQIVHFVREIT